MSEVLKRPSTFFFFILTKPNYLFAGAVLCFQGLSVNGIRATNKKKINYA